MGTMDVISLDDTIDNDASLFVIDESPMPIIMEEVTNKQTFRGKKRKSNDKKNLSKKKKKKVDLNAISNANWVVIGSHSDSLQMNNNRASSKVQSDSRSSSFFVCQNDSKISRRSENGKNDSLETIVIASDDEDNFEEMDVIELSDEEVGIIGGELSTAGINAQNHPSAFQRCGRNNNKRPWYKSLPKNSSPTAKSSSVTNKKEESARSLRPIVIDGSNVAFGHGARVAFSSKGLKICCDYFLKRGHTVKVFVPQFRRRHRATCDTHILDKLEKERILIFTPSRMVNGKQVVSYDDRYIVEYATKCGGIIVSRDNFKDLITENHEWKETIDKRLLMYTWVDDMIMFPQDPLGRNGPTLEDFLSFPPETSKDNMESEVTVGN